MGADSPESLFWNDLADDLKDPELLRDFVRKSIRISTIEQIVNDLDTARLSAKLSKAALARAINAEPAVVRRLFSAGHVNPTLGTLAEVAAALGLRVTLEPLPVTDRDHITRSLVDGRTTRPLAVTKHVSGMRKPKREQVAS
jgi:transcriptional regulator with XRE-family HTH domain